MRMPVSISIAKGTPNSQIGERIIGRKDLLTYIPPTSSTQAGSMSFSSISHHDGGLKKMFSQIRVLNRIVSHC
jgi:hypothetical protein